MFDLLSWEWRFSWSSADRRCSNYIWVINNFSAYWSAFYIRDLTVLCTAERYRKDYFVINYATVVTILLHVRWHYSVETLSALRAPHKGPVVQSFDNFFGVILNKRLNKLSNSHIIKCNIYLYQCTTLSLYCFRSLHKLNRISGRYFSSAYRFTIVHDSRWPSSVSHRTICCCNNALFE